MGQSSADGALFFPDVENLVAAFLGTRGELDGVYVGVALPTGFDGGSRAVVVNRLGGGFRSDDFLDDVIALVDAYGGDKTSAHAVANAVRGVLPLITVAGHAGGVVVSEVEESQGPCWSPDRRNGGASRYVMRYRFVVPVRPVSA
ncbi:hypothetical protein [Actinophytocola oryzae]|uniref:Tail terminator n=1 Tax=Actinophytocola oryzae TaxID=502181 RepID=A0A4R7VF46_9PSEU|nr:hypothetical protein [Actinophytocola oryzae]TDV47846.1 hypothetical protein CLV71_10981 [Actinophytocola oryzae]